MAYKNEEYEFNEDIKLSENKLSNFLNKFDASELEFIKSVLYFTYRHQTIKDSIEPIYSKKIGESYCDKKYFDIANKFKKLNDEELNLLYNIADEASLCLSTVCSMDFERETEAVNKLYDSVYKEADRRKIKMLY